MAGVLGALLGEADTKTKTFSPVRALTGEEVVAIVAKFVKNLDETLAALRDSVQPRPDDVAKAEVERAALVAYLPAQLDEAALERVARERASAGDDMGKTMAFLKANFPGAYDGRLASAVVKRVQTE